MRAELLVGAWLSGWLAPVATADACGGCDDLCRVIEAADIPACGQKRMAIHGTVRRIHVSKVAGTGLFLGDGTRIIVTYGKQPPQWERFFGKRVCVRARVVPNSPLHPSSIAGHHLSEWDFPVLKPAGGGMQAEQGEQVTLTGTAENAKGGAVLVVDGGGVFYLAGLDAWPDEVLGKQVQVSGTRDRLQYLPEARRDEDGAWSQGAVGQQDMIDSPTWKLAE